MINVTKTFLPPQQEYQEILQRAWRENWITNRGVLVQELEAEISTYLKVKNLIVTTNGTLPIQIAIKALKLTGEIITTPFSYVATTSSIVWEGCTPVFVDIHQDYLTIDETLIEAAITSKTTAILATHVFGNPCHIEAIELIAKKHDLKVIYDAAHCFGVTYKNKSIFNYGDVSTCSCHATKVFHTGEGGAIFTNDKVLKKDMFHLHNFGHDGSETFHGIGINAKISELQAAMGLAVLPYMDRILESRESVVLSYKKALANTNLKCFKLREDTQWNYSYFPVIFESEQQLLNVQKALSQEQIFPRRYFYPSLNTLPYVEKMSCPVSENIAKTVLCLPLYHDISKKDTNLIVDIILKHL